MISDEELTEITKDGSYWQANVMEMATELLAYREEKRKTEEARAKSWKGAPKWAHWRATDRNGVVFLYEHKPTPCRDEWLPPPAGARIMKYVDPVRGWKDTLEERP